MAALHDVGFAERFTDVDRLRGEPVRRDTLVDLLAEQSPIYQGRSSNETAQLRGYVLASFETVGLPPRAMPFVLEELESGINPYVVAAAAKAIRGATEVPKSVVDLLLAAIGRIRRSDDVVRYDRGRATEGPPVTALMELFRTLGWLGARASLAASAIETMLAERPALFSEQVIGEARLSLNAIRDAAPASPCCGAPPPLVLPPRKTAAAATDVAAIEMQDQDGATVRFGELFHGRPSVVTFFYTRCMNANKCSLTITKLASLQRLIAAEGMHGRVNVAAISYDPEFDLPLRLNDYGAARGMRYDDRNRLLRTTGPFDPLQRWLDLGVGYGASTVNQHRLDIAVLDSRATLVTQFSRLQWREADIIDALKSALASRRSSS